MNAHHVETAASMSSVDGDPFHFPPQACGAPPKTNSSLKLGAEYELGLRISSLKWKGCRPLELLPKALFHAGALMQVQKA